VTQTHSNQLSNHVVQLNIDKAVDYKFTAPVTAVTAAAPDSPSGAGKDEPTAKQSAAHVQGLLDLIDANCPRNDWLRVGDYLKRSQEDGEEMWETWSKTADNPSQKLDAEWLSLGQGNPCSIGSL
jgi:hypothetical protein